MIQKNVPLSDKNWFQTGGTAAHFATVETQQQFQEALTYAQTHTLDIFVLGGGANVLISDEGFDGLIIHTKLNSVTHKYFDDNSIMVSAGAGVTLPDLINYCLDHNILGLEEFSGIPGTVGGSAYNNLHYFQFSLADFLNSGTIIDRATGKITEVPASWFKLGYDSSELHNKKQYLVSATLKLKKGNDLEVSHARGRQKEIIRHRCSRYPTTGTCGSFFRNFHTDEVTKTIAGTDKKMIYVAYYLDKIGVKGELSVGDAIVSHQHANMLVNKGNATSQELLEVVRAMQKKVYDAYGIIPQPECELVGFKKYPLIK